MPRSAGDSGTRSRRGKRRDGGGGGRHRTPTVADGGGAGGDGGDASKQRRTVEPSPWAPELRSAFTMLLIARGFAVFTTAISDCDETFNYWEPLHYLMYGRGLQTWEYSPEYGLRSYLYIGLHSALGFIGQLSGGADKVWVFKAVRMLLGVFSAGCETLFYNSIIYRFGPRVAAYTLLFLVVSPGMFHAAPAFLPSTFSMYMVMLAYSAFLMGRNFWALLAGATAVVVGWPFCGLIFIPMGLHMMVEKGAVAAIVDAVSSFVLVTVPTLFVDFLYYRKFVCAPCNIVLYNVFGGDRSSELYGTEPASFYVVNLLLNFNVVAVLLALAPMLFMPILSETRCVYGAAYMTPVIAPVGLWLSLMFAQAHKEERFLFVIYPLICLVAAFVVDWAWRTAMRVWVSIKPTGSLRVADRFISMFIHVGLAAFVVVSVLRATALVRYYSAPYAAYENLSNTIMQQQGKDVTVCVGKEWYRFPSHFFLPEGGEDGAMGAQFGFLRSNFRGQLPQPYLTSSNGTWAIQEGFNDMNREELSRYVKETDCDYIVDLDLEGQTEKRYAQDHNTWRSIWSAEFLDSSRSPKLSRALSIPFYSDAKNTYALYHVLERIRD